MGGEVQVPFLDGMKVGLGYDVLTGTANKSTAVTGDSLSALAQAGGQTVKTTLQIVQESSVLRQSLGISVDVQAGNVIGDASAKFKFASDIAVNSFCLYVVVGVKVSNAILTLDNPVLTQEATDLLKVNNQPRFRDRFGDRFISGIRSGGEYYAVYKVQSFDTQERSSVAAKIQARAGSPAVAGANLDLDLAKMKSESKSKLDINVFVYQSGGGNLTTETTLEKIMDKAHAFPTLVAASQAVPSSVLINDYRELRLPQDGLNFMDTRNQQETLAFNAELLGGFETVVNDIDFIRKNIDQFKNADGSSVDDKSLAKARTACVVQMDEIRSQMSKCANDALKCARSQVAPEDFARELPKTGALSGKVIVPNLIGFDLGKIDWRTNMMISTTAPFNAQAIVLQDEFASFQYLASLSPSDIGPMVPFLARSLVVIDQDPAGGSLLPKNSVIDLKLKAQSPSI